MTIEVWIKETACPYLYWHNDGWYYRIDFYQGGKSACERKSCPNVSCHNYGKAFDEPDRLKGPLERDREPGNVY